MGRGGEKKVIKKKKSEIEKRKKRKKKKKESFMKAKILPRENNEFFTLFKRWIKDFPAKLFY